MIAPQDILLSGAQISTLATLVYYAMDLFVKNIPIALFQDDEKKKYSLPLSAFIFGALTCLFFRVDLFSELGLIARYGTLGQILSGIPVAIVSMTIYEGKKVLRTTSEAKKYEVEAQKELLSDD